jgi:hypothetical protein
MDSNFKIPFHIESTQSAQLLITFSCFHIIASTNCLDHIIIKTQTAHHKITHQAFFLADSSVDVAKVIVFATVTKNKNPTTKYNTIFKKGNINSLYNL